MQHKVKTRDFFATHPVFSLDEAARSLAPRRGRAATLDRLKHHLKAGRLKVAARGVYALVPAGVPAGRFSPDPVLVALAMRPDAVFSHHTALELLGAAHSAWRQCTVYTARVHRPMALNGTAILFLASPKGLTGKRALGTRRVERRGRLVEVTGPERTLVDGFRRPALAGGLEELVTSASGFATMDLKLVEEVLRRYGAANLWAAVGWFLDRFQKTFHVSEAVLKRLERHRPQSPQYLERGTRGGVLAHRWNLIVPEALAGSGEPDER